MAGTKRRADLIEQFTDLVVGADDPHHLAERTLEVVMSLSNGRSAALFSVEGERTTLFASRGIDQSVLDLAAGIWSTERDQLERGETVYIPEREEAARSARGHHRGPAALAMV